MQTVRARGALAETGAIGFHDRLAGSWNAKYEKPAFASRYLHFRHALESLKIAGERWLDAGCGSGHFTRLLAELGATAEGVDSSEAMIEVSKSLASTSRFRDELAFVRIPTIEQLPFDDESFDGVLCSSVLEYVDDPALCLHEMRRVLKPNGSLLLSVPNRGSLTRRALKRSFRITSAFGPGWPQWTLYSRNEYSADEAVSLLARHGFTTNRTMPFGGPARLRHPLAHPLFLMIAAKG